MENRIVQLSTEQSELLFSDLAGMIGSITKKTVVDEELIEKIKMINDKLPNLSGFGEDVESALKDFKKQLNVDNIKIDQDVLTTTVRNAMERLDFGELQKFITSVGEIKKAMDEANGVAISNFSTQEILLKENFENMKNTIESVGSTSKILNATAQKTENLMIKQIAELNKYTKKANMLNYMMVTIVTIVTYTAIMFYFIPETGKDLVRSIFKGVLQ